eukprot:scaffold45906_cov15-Tisochrysis_lutea.AAC.1
MLAYAHAGSLLTSIVRPSMWQPYSGMAILGCAGKEFCSSTQQGGWGAGAPNTSGCYREGTVILSDDCVKALLQNFYRQAGHWRSLGAGCLQKGIPEQITGGAFGAEEHKCLAQGVCKGMHARRGGLQGDASTGGS